ESTDAAGAAGDRVPEVGPVDLEHVPWPIAAREEGLLFGPGSQLSQPVSDDGDAALVPVAAQPLEHRRSTDVGAVREQLADVGVVRSDDGRALPFWLRLAFAF